jgi:hypothetical protein
MGYLAAAMSATIVIAGCQSTGGEVNEQMVGAGVGAALGCGVGLLIGGRAESCLAGAAAGGLVGWGVVKLNQYQAHQVRSASADRRVYGFTQAVDTPQVKIRRGTSSPKRVRPGQDVRITTDYSVLLPPGDQSTIVKESWVLKKDGKVLARLQPQTNRRTAGGWDAVASIPIPSNAAPGTYVVEHKVAAGSSYDEDDSTFTVRG